MKSRMLSLTLALAAVVACSSLAMAWPRGGGPGGFVNVPEDKQEQVAKIYTEGRQKLYELESRKWAKQAELNAILATAKPDTSKIEALAKEIGNLSSMVYQERVALQQRILKETGVNLPLVGGPGGYGAGCGGPGGYGGGPGYGPGCGGPGGNGPGYGPGPRAGGGNLPPCCQPGQTAPQAPAQ
uniref:Periplasmic heavy metal sensor n=1 Tax=Fundidesulfovibrio putealis TaxID=270496 RepID=A0A7C4AFU9_9BACT